MPVQYKKVSPEIPDTFDVTLGDLLNPKAASCWGKLVAYAFKKWSAGDPERVDGVRCAEVYLKNIVDPAGGVRGHVEVVFRFDLPPNVPREMQP